MLHLTDGLDLCTRRWSTAVSHQVAATSNGQRQRLRWSATRVPKIKRNKEAATNLEVERDEREDKALEILDKVVENPETLRVLAALHVEQRSDL